VYSIMSSTREPSSGSSPDVATPRSGFGFERAVADIQQLLDPQSTVEHDVRLEDKIGNRRQFDVVVRGTVGGRAVLGVFECRDHADPVDQSQVDGFVTKMQSVNANFGVIVSRHGFSKAALELTRYHGIGAYSLLKQADTEPGFTVLGHWYATLWLWDDIRWSFSPASGFTFPTMYDQESVFYGQQRIKDWVLNFLETHATGAAEGWHRIVVRFPEAAQLVVDGALITIAALQVDAHRVCCHKKRKMQWTGKAMYDWHQGLLMVPPSTTLEARAQANLYDWDDYEGPLPPPTDPGTIATMHIDAELMLAGNDRPIVRDLVDCAEVFFFEVPSGELIPPVSSPAPQ
jgi:hypothetical protein